MKFLCFEITYIGFIDWRVKKFLRQNRKIAAVREYRSYKGIGLKDAKEHVDRVETAMFFKGELKSTALTKDINYHK